MLEWVRSGYFQENLPVKTEHEEAYHTLGEWTRVCGGKVFFIQLQFYNLIPVPLYVFCCKLWYVGCVYESCSVNGGAPRIGSSLSSSYEVCSLCSHSCNASNHSDILMELMLICLPITVVLAVNLLLSLLIPVVYVILLIVITTFCKWLVHFHLTISFFLFLQDSFNPNNVLRHVSVMTAPQTKSVGTMTESNTKKNAECQTTPIIVCFFADLFLLIDYFSFQVSMLLVCFLKWSVSKFTSPNSPICSILSSLYPFAFYSFVSLSML